MDKKEARKIGLLARANLSLFERQQQEEVVYQKIKRLIGGYTRIGIYISMADELNTHRVIEDCFSEGIEVCVPYITKQTLQFSLIRSWDDVAAANFGVKEPINPVPVPIEEIPIQLIPLSSFDDRRNRTGYGKGYYDSVLRKDVYKVGIAFACQQVESIDTDLWDVTLDKIMTNEKDIQ